MKIQAAAWTEWVYNSANTCHMHKSEYSNKLWVTADTLAEWKKCVIYGLIHTDSLPQRFMILNDFSRNRYCANIIVAWDEGYCEKRDEVCPSSVWHVLLFGAMVMHWSYMSLELRPIRCWTLTLHNHTEVLCQQGHGHTCVPALVVLLIQERP